MKIRLEIDALRVETFDPAPKGGRARGTVRGHEVSAPAACETAYVTCPPDSCVGSCGMSCFNSCRPQVDETCALSCTCPEG